MREGIIKKDVKGIKKFDGDQFYKKNLNWKNKINDKYIMIKLKENHKERQEETFHPKILKNICQLTKKTTKKKAKKISKKNLHNP